MKLSSLVLLLIAGFPSLAVASAEPVLGVTVDSSIDDAGQVRDWIEKEGNETLRAHDVDPVANEKSWKIGVAVTGATYDYRVQLTLERAGERLADQPQAIACECNNEQLIAKIEAGITEAVDTLEREPAAAPPSKKTTSDPPPDNPPDNLEPQPKRLGPMGITGAVLIPLGVGAAIAGGVLIARGEVVEDSGESRETTDYRPGGIALAAAGGAVLVTGIVLLVVDRVRARPRAVSLAPGAGTSGFGFVVRGRF